MNITIDSIRETEGSQTVTFECEAGQGAGVWKCEFLARVGHPYNVEFDIGLLLKIGPNCRVSPDRSPRITVRDDTVVMVGHIESRDSDGVATLRLAADSLTMIETDDDAIVEEMWLEIAVPVNLVAIYPY